MANCKNINCQECEKSIWMYSELSLVERSHIDGHLQSCSDCRKMKEEIQKVSQILKQAIPIIQEPKNAAALTNQIMEALPLKNPWKNGFLDIWDNVWLQNSLRFASMTLIVLFIWENFPDSNQLTKHIPRGKTVAFNSIAFTKKYNEIRTARKKVTYYQRYQNLKKSHI